MAAIEVEKFLEENESKLLLSSRLPDTVGHPSRITVVIYFGN
jgi:hypothetical protein